MMTVVKCFTVLVASGNGQRCIELRNVVRNHLLVNDETGDSKLNIHRFGKLNNPIAYKRICTEIAQKILPLFSDVDEYFFCSEDDRSKEKVRINISKEYRNSPLKLDVKNKTHILVFRKTLEYYMSRGLWSGMVAQS